MLKPIFLLTISLFFCRAAFAQKRDTSVYYLKNSGKVVSSKDSADYFLVILPPDTNVDKDLFIVKEFYPNGKTRFIGGSRINKLQAMYPNGHGFYKPILQGSYISFFPNGHKMKVCNYENGEPVGDELEYYPNGKFYNSKTYKKDKLLFNELRDSTGKVVVENGNGKWVKFSDERFDKNYTEGEIHNGLQEGEWIVKVNDSIKIVNIYKKGESVASALFDEAGNRIYTLLEVVPEFVGGLRAFDQFLGDNIRYPDFARKNNIHGRVIISMVVQSDGSLGNVKVAKGIGGGCDEEAMRVIKLSGPWKPGLVNGKGVPVAYSIPIAFTLTN